jgi:hypothetical protein
MKARKKQRAKEGGNTESKNERKKREKKETYRIT